MNIPTFALSEMRISNYLFGVFLLGLSSFAGAQGNSINSPGSFLKGKEEGWFWYEVEPEPIEPKAPEPKKVEVAKEMPTIIKLEKQKPKALSVEWFNAEYPKILNTAIDNPTDENVKAYRYATRVLLDKASNFTRTFQRQSLLDPMLDESNRMPFSSAMRGAFMRMTTEQKKKATDVVAKKAGLWVFLDDKCPYCAMQYPLVARTAKERGIEVVYITPDGKRPSWMLGADEVRKDMGQGRNLKIQVRPAVALVIPPEKVTVLTQGMLSQDLLEERILVAGDAAGLITGEVRKQAFPEERGILTPEDIREIGESIQKDPKSIVPGAQERIQKRY